VICKTRWVARGAWQVQKTRPRLKANPVALRPGGRLVTLSIGRVPFLSAGLPHSLHPGKTRRPLPKAKNGLYIRVDFDKRKIFARCKRFCTLRRRAAMLAGNGGLRLPTVTSRGP
jgi:hypothetical protein